MKAEQKQLPQSEMSFKRSDSPSDLTQPSNGLLRLKLEWMSWSRASSRTVTKTLVSMMMATRTLTWNGMNLRWNVTCQGQLVTLELWQQPAVDNSLDGV